MRLSIREQEAVLVSHCEVLAPWYYRAGTLTTSKEGYATESFEGFLYNIRYVLFSLNDEPLRIQQNKPELIHRQFSLLKISTYPILHHQALCEGLRRRRALYQNYYYRGELVPKQIIVN